MEADPSLKNNTSVRSNINKGQTPPAVNVNSTSANTTTTTGSKLSKEEEQLKEREKAKSQVETLYQLSLLLETGLDKQSLGYCLTLLESGVNPEALAAVLKELKQVAPSGGSYTY